MTPYLLYLADDILPNNHDQAKVIRINAGSYTLVGGHLFIYGHTHPLLTCVDEEQANRILVELHKGIYGSHLGGRALSHKVTRAGYFWPTLKEDSQLYVKKMRTMPEKRRMTPCTTRRTTLHT